MRYARKNYSKGRRGLKKRISWKRPTAYNQKRQLFTLAKQVSVLRKVQRSRAIYGRFKNQWTGKEVSSDYITQNLTDVSSWTGVFENPDLIAEKNKVKLLSIGIDTLITCSSENSAVTYTYFIVSLKPQVAKHLVENAGEGLGQLNPDEHYTFLQGMTMLNKKYFNIHKCRRFTLSEENYNSHGLTEATSGKNQAKTWKRFYDKISFPRWLNDGQENWRGMDTNAVPLGSRLYCLVFNDNSIADLENPLLQQTMIATVKA